ncbi:MAG: hypothetical protein LBB05_02490 [Puniceicoccales bacterium]|jgi:ankyrin repeat protein|nr:hypothetical protein [Puniceicoccales bacterium]
MKKNIELITLFLLSGVQFYEEVSGSSDALSRRSLAIRNAERSHRRKSLREAALELEMNGDLSDFNEDERGLLNACSMEDRDKICFLLKHIIEGLPIDLGKIPFPNGALIDILRILYPMDEGELLLNFVGLVRIVPYNPLVLDENGENCVQISRRLGYHVVAQVLLNSFRSAAAPLHFKGCASEGLMQVEAAFSSNDFGVVFPIVADFMLGRPGEASKVRLSNGNTILMQMLEMGNGALVPSLMEDKFLAKYLELVPYNPYQCNDKGKNAILIARDLGLSDVILLLDESARKRQWMDKEGILEMLRAIRDHDVLALERRLASEETHCFLDILLLPEQFPAAFRGLRERIAGGLTLFMYAAMMACVDGNTDLLVLLLDRGVNSDMRNRGGKCALDIIRELLEAGLQALEVDSVRAALPPYLQAFANVIELLEGFDDDGRARALSLKSIREMAVEEQLQHALEGFDDKSIREREVEERLKPAIMNGEIGTACSIVKTLEDFNVKYQDEGGDTILMWAMQTAHSKLAILFTKVFLSRVAETPGSNGEKLGIDGALEWAKTTTNNAGDTAVHMAPVREDLGPVVRLFLPE